MSSPDQKQTDENGLQLSAHPKGYRRITLEEAATGVVGVVLMKFFRNGVQVEEEYVWDYLEKALVPRDGRECCYSCKIWSKKEDLKVCQGCGDSYAHDGCATTHYECGGTYEFEEERTGSEMILEKLKEVRSDLTFLLFQNFKDIRDPELRRYMNGTQLSSRAYVALFVFVVLLKLSSTYERGIEADLMSYVSIFNAVALFFLISTTPLKEAKTIRKARRALGMALPEGVLDQANDENIQQEGNEIDEVSHEEDDDEYEQRKPQKKLKA